MFFFFFCVVFFFVFFFNDTATTEIYTLSLHDALPILGVDPVSRRELWAIVYRQVQAQGMSVLLSTAYLDEAERCDEVLLLHQGKLLGQGPPMQFSVEVEGRVFQVSAAGISHRQLQTRLSQAPGVLDALVEGETVRLVMDEVGEPSAASLLPDLDEVHIKPAAPRFEDTFVARLKTRHDGAAALGSLDLHIEARGDDEVIRVQHLLRRFGDFIAVNDVSFSVRRGEIFGLLGANGAGKTTTFRMLCGLLPASGGELSVAGHDLHTARAEARRSSSSFSSRSFASPSRSRLFTVPTGEPVRSAISRANITPIRTPAIRRPKTGSKR